MNLDVKVFNSKNNSDVADLFHLTGQRFRDRAAVLIADLLRRIEELEKAKQSVPD